MFFIIYLFLCMLIDKYKMFLFKLADSTRFDTFFIIILFYSKNVMYYYNNIMSLS